MGKSAPVTPSAENMDHGLMYGATLGIAQENDPGITAAPHHAQGMVAKAHDVGLAIVLVKEYAIMTKIRALGTKKFVVNFWSNFTYLSQLHYQRYNEYILS